MTKIEEFKKEMEKLYPQYDFSKCIYTKSRSDVIVIVPEYGEVLAKPYILRKGQWKPYRWTTQKFITEAKKRFPDKEFDYSRVNYKNNDTKIIIGCPVHGYFEIRPGDFLRQTGCPLCKPKSLRELFISSWLDEHNVSFKHNFKVNLSGDRYVLIDFVINNVFVEYNGIQHYKDIKFFKTGSHFQNTPFDFKLQQERDKLVQEYCDKNNIKLIWLNYKQSDKDIIEKLKEII